MALSDTATESSATVPAVPALPRWAWVLGLGAGLVLAVLVVVQAPRLQHAVYTLRGTARIEVAAATERDVRQAERHVERLHRRLTDYLPRRPYLVVSSTDNTFQLKRGAEVLRGGLCSTGSYVQLKGSEGREWLFETPRGRREIQGKRTNPVWTKPDWAFVEAGLPIPPMGSPARIERGVLGDYALALGDGYLIHGTLYQRLLGRPVTHGCIRLGDADLEAVYRALPIGSPVFIY